MCAPAMAVFCHHVKPEATTDLLLHGTQAGQALTAALSLSPPSLNLVLFPNRV